MDKPKSLTLRDLSRVTGIPRSTLSAALRNDPRIARATRERVHALAEHHGYRQDARVSELMRVLNQRKQGEGDAPIAFVHASARKDDWLRLAWRRPILDGIREAAERQSFRVESFWMGPGGHRPERVIQILKTRGIRGAVLAPPYHADTFGAFPEAPLACTTLEEASSFLPYSHVSASEIWNLDLTLNRLQENGFSRIGLTCPDSVADKRLNKLESRMLWYNSLIPEKDRIAPLVYGYDVRQRKDGTERLRPRTAQVLPWLEAHQPDVIICNDAYLLPFLTEMGMRVPDDFSLVHLSLADDVPDWAGIDRNSSAIGQAAVDLLISKLLRNQVGPVDSPYQLRVRGTWRDGWTLRSRRARKPKIPARMTGAGD